MKLSSFLAYDRLRWPGIPRYFSATTALSERGRPPVRGRRFQQRVCVVVGHEIQGRGRRRAGETECDPRVGQLVYVKRP